MTEWWQDLFDEKYLKLFAEARDPLQTAQEVEGLMALMQRHGVPEDGEVLDLACGYGRITLPLADLGYRMTGFDLAPVLLDRARRPPSRRAWISSGSGAICASCLRPGWVASTR